MAERRRTAETRTDSSAPCSGKHLFEKGNKLAGSRKGIPLDTLWSLTLNIGDVWMLVAMCLWAAQTILIRFLPKGMDLVAFKVAAFVAGLVVSLPFYIFETAVFTLRRSLRRRGGKPRPVPDRLANRANSVSALPYARPGSTTSPGCARCSLNRSPEGHDRSTLASVVLRTSIGSRLRSVPFSSSKSKA